MTATTPTTPAKPYFLFQTQRESVVATFSLYTEHTLEELASHHQIPLFRFLQILNEPESQPLATQLTDAIALRELFVTAETRRAAQVAVLAKLRSDPGSTESLRLAATVLRTTNLRSRPNLQIPEPSQNPAAANPRSAQPKMTATSERASGPSTGSPQPTSATPESAPPPSTGSPQSTSVTSQSAPAASTGSPQRPSVTSESAPAASTNSPQPAAATPENAPGASTQPPHHSSSSNSHTVAIAGPGSASSSTSEAPLQRLEKAA